MNSLARRVNQEHKIISGNRMIRGLYVEKSKQNTNTYYIIIHINEETMTLRPINIK